MKKYCTFLFLIAALTVSCERVFDIKPEDAVDESQAFQDLGDADAAILGIYGQFVNLAEQYVLLNELRADLLTTTSNADPYLQQLSEHRVQEGNPYISTKKFYEVIFNINDALSQLKKMRQENRLSEAEYNQRYSDLGALRSWIYLQLGIHFGEVPYVTQRVATEYDINEVSSLPKIDFGSLLDNLISFTSALPHLDTYAGSSTLLFTLDGYATNKIFINKRLLLGDLYLWKNNYNAAAKAYRAVLETGGEGEFDTYKIIYADVVTNNDLSVGYARYREQDINTLVNNNSQGWRSIFSRSRDVLWNTEWVWAIPFEGQFAPVYPFVNLFEKNGGSYLLKPAKRVINAWNSQIQQNGFPFDARGIFSYALEGEEPVVKKYTYGIDPANPLRRSGNWFLARAALVHLRFAEAANREGHSRLAYALLNNGLASEYDDPSRSDKTNVQQTFLPAPYNFDARNSGSGAPYYRATWHKHVGLRSRAYLRPHDAALKTNVTGLEDALLDEAALELAFEGNRWADLVRISKRRNDPSILANRVADKLSQEGNPLAEQVRVKLLDERNWYLPFGK